MTLHEIDDAIRRVDGMILSCQGRTVLQELYLREALVSLRRARAIHTGSQPGLPAVSP